MKEEDEGWELPSLEWIQTVREAYYESTRDLPVESWVRRPPGGAAGFGVRVSLKGPQPELGESALGPPRERRDIPQHAVSRLRRRLGSPRPEGIGTRCWRVTEGARAYNHPVPSAEAEWVRRWQRTGVALSEIKRRSLRVMTDDQARAASAMLLSLTASAYMPPRRRSYSGLVEQQALFRTLRGS